jgi:hypothetical protein
MSFLGFSMKTSKNMLWTWLLPDRPRTFDRTEWMRRGGKWIVFDNRKEIGKLAEKLAPHIDSGEISSAKYWNGDPSAINVYSLDRDRGKVRRVLKQAGARYVLVWEYDYALGKNLLSPLIFAYSWFSKFRTILQSYGLAGSLQLLKQVLLQRREE